MLDGLGASAGIAAGIARVFPHGIHPDAALSKQDILVLPSLDPGHTGIMGRVGGLVIERGGLLSHAAIVAREYGIPLVIGVAGVVDALETGRAIEIDGTAGTVQIEQTP